MPNRNPRSKKKHNRPIVPVTPSPRSTDVHPPFEVSPISPTPTPVTITTPQTSVRVANPDLLLVTNSQLPVESMVDLVLDDIGGQEIINISRTDLINGVNNSYQLISDSLSLAENYNSKTLIPMPGQSDFYFNSQSINFLSKIPANALGTSDDFLIVQISTTVNGTTTLKDRYIPIINVIGDGTTATYTTAIDHNLSIGDYVKIVGIEPVGYNTPGTSYEQITDTPPSKDVFVLDRTTTASYVSSIKTVYFETDTGDLIVEVENMESNEFVEIEIINSLTIFDDTMY